MTDCQNKTLYFLKVIGAGFILARYSHENH